jgi:RNA polymerase-binding transcription factor DksA
LKRCTDCKQPIPTKRLRALPDAIRCVGCQSPHDKRITPDECNAMAEMGDLDFEIAAVHSRSAEY